MFILRFLFYLISMAIFEVNCEQKICKCTPLNGCMTDLTTENKNHLNLCRQSCKSMLSGDNTDQIINCYVNRDVDQAAINSEQRNCLLEILGPPCDVFKRRKRYSNRYRSRYGYGYGYRGNGYGFVPQQQSGFLFPNFFPTQPPPQPAFEQNLLKQMISLVSDLIQNNITVTSVDPNLAVAQFTTTASPTPATEENSQLNTFDECVEKCIKIQTDDVRRKRQTLSNRTIVDDVVVCAKRNKCDLRKPDMNDLKNARIKCTNKATITVEEMLTKFDNCIKNM